MSILKLLFGEIPPLDQLSEGLFALPTPEPKKPAQRKEKAVDAYIERAETNTWGFHVATAVRQNEGSAPDLTEYDIELLKDRGYWGKKSVVLKNSSAKAAWHSGKNEKEAATTLGVSVSWVEKRFGTFSSALAVETGRAELL